MNETSKEKENKILWINSTLSGLGDRLLDLLLMTTYARFKKSKLVVPWKVQPKGVNPEGESVTVANPLTESEFNIVVTEAGDSNEIFIES